MQNMNDFTLLYKSADFDCTGESGQAPQKIYEFVKQCQNTLLEIGGQLAFLSVIKLIGIGWSKSDYAWKADRFDHKIPVELLLCGSLDLKIFFS